MENADGEQPRRTTEHCSERLEFECVRDIRPVRRITAQTHGKWWTKAFIRLKCEENGGQQLVWQMHEQGQSR